MSRPPIFSDSQRRIVATGATALGGVLLLATAFILFLLLRRFVASFQDVLLPLAIAAILATLLRPIIDCCERRTRLSQTQGILLLFLLVILSLAVVAVFVIPPALAQTTEFLKQLPEIRDNLFAFVQTHFPAVWTWLRDQLGESPEVYLKNFIEQNSNLVKDSLDQLKRGFGSATAVVTGMFGSIAAYSVIPIYLFFILNRNRDQNIWRDIEKQLNFLPEDRRDDLVFLARQFSEILIASSAGRSSSLRSSAWFSPPGSGSRG